MSTYQFDHGPGSDHCLDSTLVAADSERTNTFELSTSSTKTTRLQLDVDLDHPSTRSFAVEAKLKATTQEIIVSVISLASS
jgi:hypothetical protein